MCSVGLDMIAVPGDIPASTISGIIADEAAIGMVNQKTTAVRVIPVLELPVCFATGSANDFASCGVALLDRLGVVGTLCFGTESGDLCQLSQLALVLGQEPAEYVDELQKRLRQGMSFPKARSLALLHYFSPDPSSPSPFGPDWGEMLSSPQQYSGCGIFKGFEKKGQPHCPPGNPALWPGLP